MTTTGIFGDINPWLLLFGFCAMVLPFLMLLALWAILHGIRNPPTPTPNDRRQADDQPPSPHSTDFDPYRILGVRRDATREEIRSAYLSLIKQYHPDKVHHLGQQFRDLAGEKTKEINRAYDAVRGGVP